MNISDKGIALIKEFEGFRANAYICPAGKNTIGYGHVIKNSDRFDAPLSEADADELLRDDIDTYYAPSVVAMTHVPLSQGQFDALCSFAYNCGIGALMSSTLMRKLNAGDASGAADEFLRWNKVSGQPFAGLTRRREAERALFVESTA